MQIQSYQIHNVLNVYRRQLSQPKTDAFQPSPAEGAGAESKTVAVDGGNRSVMDKVAANVLKKIRNVVPHTAFQQEMVNQVQAQTKDLHAEGDDSEFVFNTIAENNQKETRSIAIDDSRVLMSRLDELAKAAVHRKAKETT